MQAADKVITSDSFKALMSFLGEFEQMPFASLAEEYNVRTKVVDTKLNWLK